MGHEEGLHGGLYFGRRTLLCGKAMRRKDKLRSRTPRRGCFTPAELNAFVQSGQYQFWLAHGANYLASALKEGIWRPLFHIYSGQEFPLERMLREVYFRYSTPEEEMQPPGPAIIRWCRQSPERVLRFYLELRDRSSTDQRATLNLPHAEYVWEVFNKLGDFQ